MNHLYCGIITFCEKHIIIIIIKLLGRKKKDQAKNLSQVQTEVQFSSVWPGGLSLKDWSFCFSPCLLSITIGRSLCCSLWFVYAADLVDISTFSKKFGLVSTIFTPGHKALENIGVDSLLHLSLIFDTL